MEEQSNKGSLNIFVVVVIILLIGAVSFLWISRTQDIPGTTSEATAICIAENSIMYGTEWCSYCNMQKNMFGENADLLNFVDCDTNKEVCIDAGVKVFPTWVINNELYTGVRSEEELMELTGC